MLKKTSTLSLLQEKEDILTSYLEISFLRLKTEEQARNGISTEPQELSNLDPRINLLISRAQVNLMLSNTTQPTQDGGRFGDSLVHRLNKRTDLCPVKSSIVNQTECLLLRMDKTKKLNQLFVLMILERAHLNNGLSDILIRWEMKLIKRKVKEMLIITCLLLNHST
jgi:hypothetical protein